jgi:hypothetical protein
MDLRKRLRSARRPTDGAEQALRPASDNERLALARIAFFDGNYKGSALEYERYFGTDLASRYRTAREVVRLPYIYDDELVFGARAAVRAAALPDAEPSTAARWREKAREWLGQFVHECKSSRGEPSAEALQPIFLASLYRLRVLDEFAPFRGGAPGTVQEPERYHWERLWSELDELIAEFGKRSAEALFQRDLVPPMTSYGEGAGPHSDGGAVKVPGPATTASGGANLNSPTVVRPRANGKRTGSAARDPGD